MRTLKKLYHNKLISIIIWLIIIFIAILKLPNVTNTITSQGQPQFTNKSQIVKGENIQSHWGRNISGTQEIQVVYNNPHGNITSSQQSSINKSIKNMRKNMHSSGIKQINSIENNPNEKYRFKSNDESTEIVQLYVEPQVTGIAQNLNNLRNLISGKLSNRLNAYVTSPSIVNQAAYQKIANITHIITFVLFILAMLIIGIFFKSIIAPFISLVTLLVSYIVSISLITNLSSRFHFPFNAYTPLMTLLGTIILGSIFLFIFYHKFHEEVFNSGKQSNYTPATIKQTWKIITIISIVLAVAFGGSILTKFSSVRALAPIGISFIVLLFAIMTLLPIFTSLLDESIFWPNKRDFQLHPHKLWNKLTRFSLWQPIAGIVIVLYFIIPFTLSYRNNLDYTNNNYISQTDQAVIGANTLKAHFNQGKPTPVTIYLQNNDKLNNEASLEAIDSLTTKLQTMKHVKAVYSVTQPSSMPISKYYVKNQLNSIISGINKIKLTLHNADNTSNKTKKQLDLKQLNRQINYLNTIVSKSNHSVGDNESLQNRLETISNNTTTAPQTTRSKRINRKLQAYQNKMDQLNSDLASTNGQLNSLNSNSRSINNYAQTVQSNLGSYKDQLKQVNSDLNTVKHDVSQANRDLNNIYNYLDGLRNAAGKFYYITPGQMEDTDFQQNVHNYTSSNGRITKLDVVFQNAPNNLTSHELKHLRSEVKTEIQGTKLKHDNIVLAGEPVKHATIQTNYQHSLIKAFIIASLVILIVMMITGRTILHPIYWLSTLIISGIAGLQLTNLTMNYIFNITKINWYASLLILFVLIILAAVELIPVGIMFRKRNISMLQWFEPSLTTLGQPIRYIMSVVIITILGLLFVPNAALAETTLTVIYTIIIFNIALPMIIASFGKLSYTIPNPDLRRTMHVFHHKDKH